MRPDLVIFDEEVAGNFRYYKDGDKKQDNSAIKRDCLRCIIEIKGGAHGDINGLNNDKAVERDIEKLGRFRLMLQKEDKDYLFLAFDQKAAKGNWSSEKRIRLGQICIENQIHMIYYAQGQREFWHYSFHHAQPTCYKLA
jgi:hypothetical protein